MVAARRIILLTKVDLRAVTAIAIIRNLITTLKRAALMEATVWKIKIMKVVVEGGLVTVR